jgi:two-component system, OmpR family, sensor kinase
MKTTTLRLFWKIFLFQLMSLLGLGLILTFLAGAFIDRRADDMPVKMSLYAASLLEDSRDNPAQLQRELARLKTQLDFSASVYQTDGTLQATNLEPPLPLPAAADLPMHHALSLGVGPPGFTSTVAIRGGYVSLSFTPPTPTFSEFLFAALVSISFVALVSSLPARQAIKPMENLAMTAKRFGEGDLTARATTAKTDEIGQVAQAFNEMAERVSQLLFAEKEMLANVSHELKTPLARIRVLLDLATEEAEESSTQTRYVKEIVSDLAELERLVEDILTATRLDIVARRVGDPVPLRCSPVDLKELLERSVSRFQTLHSERRLQLSLSSVPQLYADAALLRRAIDNLLDNAQKYSSPHTSIMLRSFVQSQRLLIEVIDQGIGIQPQELAQLFTPFYRGDKNRTQSTGGVGLGLVLCRRIIEAHGGTIAVFSNQASTVFRISLPLS